MSAYTDELKHAIAQTHGSDAIWTGSIPVKEVLQGETAWEGVVETFFLTNHPKAKRCYAWGVRRDHDKGWDVTAVLCIPPIYSAQDAVKAAIIAQAPQARAQP